MKKDDVIWLEIHEPYDFVTLFGFEPIQIKIFSVSNINEDVRVFFTCDFEFENTKYGFGHMSSRYVGEQIPNELEKVGMCISQGEIAPEKYTEYLSTISTGDVLNFFSSIRGGNERIGFIGSAQTYPTRKR
jgi:hypothetical protein